MRKILLLNLFLINILYLYSNTVSSGLYFSSHSVIKENRTSLYFSTNDIELNKGFSLDFDIKLRPELHNYGYIFRIIVNGNKSFDLISNFSSDRRSLSLIEGNTLFISFEKDSLDSYLWNKWAHIKCNITPDKVSLYFNDKEVSTKCDYPDLKKLEIYFGYSTHKLFSSSDVPPMTIRDIRVTNNKSRSVAYWPLREHNQDVVYDSISNRPAKAVNPIWEIDKHIKWAKEKEFILPIYSQVSFNNLNNHIYLAAPAVFLEYSVPEDRVDTILPPKGNPYVERYNQMTYNPYYNELWSYDFDKNIISSFNFDKKEWSNTDLEIKNPDFSQHNAFISTKDSLLYIFGGYGNYQYKNGLLRKGKNEKEWENIDYEPKLTPRYLGGLGYKNKDTILIFGGCGNVTGKQELGSNNIFDLHSMDIRTFKTHKLWEITNKETDFVVGNNIIVDKGLNKLFALCFPNDRSNTYILMRSFDLSTGISSTYADTIPFTFEDVNSYCTLYHNDKDSKIYAVTAYNQNKTTNVKVYSLAYPPLNKDSISQPVSISYLTYYIIGILVIIALAIIIFIVIKNNRSKKENKKITTSKKEEPLPDACPYIPHTQSSIILLGGFQVWDKKGENITKLFTPVLKQLLILIILYGQKNKKGIPNVTLREILWFDKTDESAQNNRRVNIRKLKVLLEELDGFELTKDNTYWLLDFNPNAYCDYIEVCNFMDKLKDGRKITSEDLKKFPIDILSGQLLPYVQNEWLDSFKSDYSNAILDALISLSKQDIVKDNDSLMIQIANLMFVHDKTDEYALSIKCQALCRSGKISLAKSTFDTFCAEYKAMLDTEYKKSFKEIGMPDE